MITKIRDGVEIKWRIRDWIVQFWCERDCPPTAARGFFKHDAGRNGRGWVTVVHGIAIGASWWRT